MCLYPGEVRIRRAWGSIALSLALLPVAACGIVLGADREAANARREFTPIDEQRDLPNPLAGGGSAGDRSSQARRRQQQKKDAATATTTTTMPIPRSEWEFVPAAPGLVLEGVLEVEAPNSPYRDRLPAVLPGGETRAEVDLWPRSWDPGQVPTRSPWCSAVLRFMAAGDSLWARYGVATLAARQMLVNELIGSMRMLAENSEPALAGVLVEIADEATVMFAGPNAGDGQKVAEFMVAGGRRIGTLVQPVVTRAAGDCDLPSADPSDRGLPGYGQPTEESVRTRFG